MRMTSPMCESDGVSAKSAIRELNFAPKGEARLPLTDRCSLDVSCDYEQIFSVRACLLPEGFDLRSLHLETSPHIQALGYTSH